MNFYDYSRGLKAPYTMQIIKSPQGKVVWIFAQPISLSYILLFFGGLFLTGMLWVKYPFPKILGINLNLLLMLYAPNKFARWYSETEFEGKTGAGYLKDCLFYTKDFVLDSRAIVAFKRVKEIEEFSFRR